MKIKIEFRIDNTAFRGYGPGGDPSDHHAAELKHVMTAARNAIDGYLIDIDAEHLTGFEHSLHDSKGKTIGAVSAVIE